MRHLSILQGLGTMLDTVWQREESEVKRETEGREEERGLLELQSCSASCSGVLGGCATPWDLVLGTFLEGTVKSNGSWQKGADPKVLP